MTTDDALLERSHDRPVDGLIANPLLVGWADNGFILLDTTGLAAWVTLIGGAWEFYGSWG